MSVSVWFVFLLLVLVVGVVLFGIVGWVCSYCEYCSLVMLKIVLQFCEEGCDIEVMCCDLLGWIECFGCLFSGGCLEVVLFVNEDKLLLDLVGWNMCCGIVIYFGLCLLFVLLVLVLVLVFSSVYGFVKVMVVIGVLVVGLLLFKFVLLLWVKCCCCVVENELFLLIDLLCLLQGVGFSMDQSLQMLGDKLCDVLLVFGGELQEVNVVYIYGCMCVQLLWWLSEVYVDDDLVSLMQLILQVYVYGGVVQELLCQFSIWLCEQCCNVLKEKVGKFLVKMIVVMMLILLLVLMLVFVGLVLVVLVIILFKMGFF